LRQADASTQDFRNTGTALDLAGSQAGRIAQVPEQGVELCGGHRPVEELAAVWQTLVDQQRIGGRLLKRASPQRGGPATPTRVTSLEVAIDFATACWKCASYSARATRTGARAEFNVGVELAMDRKGRTAQAIFSPFAHFAGPRNWGSGQPELGLGAPARHFLSPEMGTYATPPRHYYPQASVFTYADIFY
jgi:hypothetical protein